MCFISTNEKVLEITIFQPIFQVISLKTQIGYFRNVSRLLREKLGEAEAITLLSKSVYLFSVGANDYSFLFDTNSSALDSFSNEEFVGLVIGNIRSAIEVLSYLVSDFISYKYKVMLSLYIMG